MGRGSQGEDDEGNWTGAARKKESQRLMRNTYTAKLMDVPTKPIEF